MQEEFGTAVAFSVERAQLSEPPLIPSLPALPMPTRHTVGHHVSKLQAAESEPDDERVGDYTREALLMMDQRFCAAVERAISRGLERRPAEHQARAAA